jgi:O-antigen/teichoic acid export membrane protein
MKALDRTFDRLRGLSPRARAVGLFFASSIFSRGVGAACQILQVPIAIKALGGEAFGLWISLMSVSYLVTFADFGLGQGTQNRLAEAFASGRDGDQQDLFANSFILLSGVGLLLYLSGSLLVGWVDFASLFHIRAPDVRASAPAAVRTVLLFFCINFPLGLAQRLSYARQKGWMHNLAQAAAGIASVAGIAVAASRGAGLVGIIAIVQSTVVVGSLVLLAVQFHQLGWIRSFGGRLRRSTVRGLMGLGGFFALQQVLTVALFSLPQVIIATSLGAASVTSYNLAQRLFNVFAIVQGAFMIPLWPVYSEAASRSEYAWIRRTLWKSVKATVVFTVIPMAIASLGARRLIALWVGPSAELPSTELVWILFAWNAFVFLQQPFGYMLAGISEIRRITVYAVIGTVASVTFMELFVRPWGAEGVVLGLLCGFVPFYFIGAVHQALSVLRSRIPETPAPQGHELSRQVS